MPAYNCQQYVKFAIDSVLKQTYKNFELLIADDASTDDTKNIINSYTDSRIKLHHNSKNLGYLKTSNNLVSICKGSFITFQDADDTCAENRFEILLNEFKLNNNLACVGSFVTRVDENNNTLSLIEFKTNHNQIKNDLPNTFNCVGSALMVKKNVINTLGLYHNYFDRIGSEDLFWFGLIVKNYETKNCALPLYHYRVTPNSISNDLNKTPKKLMSGELAKLALMHYYKTNTIIFDNKYKLKILENYLIGKGLCWQTHYKKGLVLILKSILLNPFAYTERYKLITMYLPKLLK